MWGILIALLLASCGAAEERRPNVMLVTIESLRTDHVGAYGGHSRTRPEEPLTPALDDLAAESVLYQNANATSSWTLTSHASLFTGLYPTGHRTIEPLDRLAESHVTLAEHLAVAGYQTMGIVSGPYLRRPYNLDQGFERWDQQAASRDRKLSHADRTNPQVEETVRRFFTAERDRSRPFFLFLYLWDPHYDYLPPPPYDRLYVTSECEPFPLADWETRHDMGGGLSPGRLAYAWSQYEGEIRATDDMLGRLFATMRENGIWEETLVVVTADHGEEFFDHGMRGHKNNLYAETVHVPLIVKYPGSPPPSGRDARLASLVDVLPTVLEAAGLSTNVHSDGHSLRAAPVPDRTVLFELLALSYEGRKFPAKAYWSGIQTSERKLLWREQRQDDVPTGEVDLLQLFDVAADPLEQRNIAAERPDEVRELTSRFTAAAAPARVVAARHGDGGTAVIGDDERARLRALGYIE